MKTNREHAEAIIELRRVWKRKRLDHGLLENGHSWGHIHFDFEGGVDKEFDEYSMEVIRHDLGLGR